MQRLPTSLRPSGAAEQPPLPAASLAELAYTRFRDRLRSGELKPGERLLEVTLAESLGMSRTPVREAMRRLQADGLITHVPPRGLCVTRYDHAQVDELYAMREALEGEAARLAAENAGLSETAALQQLVEADSAVHGGPALIAEHNRQFHQALYEAAHNRYLLRSVQVIADALLLLGPTTFTVPGRAAEAQAEHRVIVQAIAARDPAAADAAARHHIRVSHRARLGLHHQA